MGGYGIRPYGFVLNACYRRGAFHMLPKKGRIWNTPLLYCGISPPKSALELFKGALFDPRNVGA